MDIRIMYYYILYLLLGALYVFGEDFNPPEPKYTIDEDGGLYIILLVSY